MRFKLKPESIAIVELTLYLNWYPGSIKSIGDIDKIRGDLALQFIAKGIKNSYYRGYKNQTFEFLTTLKSGKGIIKSDFKPRAFNCSIIGCA